MQLTIKTPSNKDIVIEISPGDSIQMLKKKIKEITYITVTNQVILFNKKRLRSGKTISFYGITESSELYLQTTSEREISIVVETNIGKTVTLELTASATVAEVKELLVEEGIEKNIFDKLEFNGQELDDNKTLENYQISNKCSLKLFCKVQKCLVQSLKKLIGK